MVRWPEAEDEVLMERIGRRDTEALRELYRRHGGRVYSLARHITTDSPRAEEITQDVFLKVWEKAGSYRSEKALPLTWMLRITRNRAIDLLRQQKSTGGVLEDFESLEPGPEDVLARDSVVAGVRDELSRLPTSQRNVLTLAYYRGLSHRQIAQALGEPLGTIKSRIRDALQKLRKRMEP
jgi:RNA polymerase sigma-70 factor (ECF subfamily)